jgi:hypothetical protein
MSETPSDPPPRERVERHEVIERTTDAHEPPGRAAAPMWAWLLPLVAVVIALVWYILMTGEPRSPTEAIPDVDLGAAYHRSPSVYTAS